MKLPRCTTRGCRLDGIVLTHSGPRCNGHVNIGERWTQAEPFDVETPAEYVARVAPFMVTRPVAEARR